MKVEANVLFDFTQPIMKYFPFEPSRAPRVDSATIIRTF
jgi:hypothetical protein